MKKLVPLFLFFALFVYAHTASADTASEWWGVHCPTLGTDGTGWSTYGKNTPYMYVGQAGVLFQLGQPFTISIRGGMKKSAFLTSSAPDEATGARPSATTTTVVWGKRMCLDGVREYSDTTSTSTAGCPNQGVAGQYAYDQQVTINGKAQPVVFRIDDGGVTFPGDKVGPQPFCQKVEVARERQTYNYTIDVDKSSFGQNEAFLVSVNGLSWLQASQMNGVLKFTRSNASFQSCENALYRGRSSYTCEGDSSLSCKLLPQTSGVQYLCAVTAPDPSRYPNKTGSVTYTVYGRDTGDLFDTYKFTGADKTITLLPQGTDGSMTNYGSCPAGEGINPESYSGACTRCQNIPNRWKSRITSCSETPADQFIWRERSIGTNGNSYSGFPASACPTGISNGTSCSVQGDVCNVSTQATYDCVNATTQGGLYHGRVLDGAVSGGASGLEGVTVTARNPTATYLGISCSGVTAQTNSGGYYEFDAQESNSLCLTLQSTSYVDFKKPGYIDGFKFVGSEYDKLILPVTLQKLGSGTPTTTPYTIAISPSAGTLQRQAGSSVTFKLTNGRTAIDDRNNLDVCYEVVKRAQDQFTPQAIDRPADPSSCKWIENWGGNSDWKTSGSDLEWTVSYDEKDANGNKIWDIPGLQVLIAFRKASDRQDGSKWVYTTMSVEGGAKSASVSESSDTSAGGGIWEGVQSAVSTIVSSVSSSIQSAWGAVTSFFTSALE